MLPWERVIYSRYVGKIIYQEIISLPLLVSFLPVLWTLHSLCHVCPRPGFCLKHWPVLSWASKRQASEWVWEGIKPIVGFVEGKQTTTNRKRKYRLLGWISCHDITWSVYLCQPQCFRSQHAARQEGDWARVRVCVTGDQWIPQPLPRSVTDWLEHRIGECRQPDVRPSLELGVSERTPDGNGKR